MAVLLCIVIISELQEKWIFKVDIRSRQSQVTTILQPSLWIYYSRWSTRSSERNL